MKISLNEIIKLVPEAGEVSTEELVRLIGSRLVEVEGTEDLAPKYKGVVVVRVAECEKIPETHLSLCKVDDGSGELTQVVCGAPNVHRGMLAAWLRPGCIVPETYGNEDFELGVRKLRGYESNGMLAAADELDLGADHEGIVEISPEEAKAGDSFAEVFGLNDVILDIENKSLTHRPDCFGVIGFAREVAGILGVRFCEPEPRTVFSAVASRTVNFENTVLSRIAPSSPSSRVSVASDEPRRLVRSEKEGIPQNSITISIENSGICERYSCAVVEMEGAEEKRKYFSRGDVFLAKAGMRSVSKIVDVTNILMLMTGQPLHAFDYDKFIAVGKSGASGGKKAESEEVVIGVRTAKAGEKLKLLDGKTIECDENDILITSGEVPVALAGAMGGASTEIDASTERILLESATFSLYHLRKTQMKHGIFSEAITRFTKGQPAGNTMPVLLAAAERLGGKILEVDDNWSPEKKAIPIIVAVKEVNSLLGTEYSVEECVKTLENVGFEVSQRSVGKNRGGKGVGSKAKEGDVGLKVTAPYWRTDIHIKEDVIEEIGRLRGFDNIPLSLATRPFIQAKVDPVFSLKRQLRGILSERLAAHEVLTYSFVSKVLQQSVGENIEESYEITNSISPELQVFRQSLIPSLLEKVYENLKAGYKDFTLYEMNQVTQKSLGLETDAEILGKEGKDAKKRGGVPKMENHLGAVVVGDFYAAKARLLAILEELGVHYATLEPRKTVLVRKNSVGLAREVIRDASKERVEISETSYLEEGRSAEVVVLGGGTVKDKWIRLGYIGEIKGLARKNLKIEPVVSAFEISLDGLVGLTGVKKKEIKISKFPGVERDVTVRIKDVEGMPEVLYADVRQAILEGLAKAFPKVSGELPEASEELTYKVIDGAVFKREEGSRNMTFHLKFAHMKKTLAAEDIKAIMGSVEEEVRKRGGEIV